MFRASEGADSQAWCPGGRAVARPSYRSNINYLAYPRHLVCTTEMCLARVATSRRGNSLSFSDASSWPRSARCASQFLKDAAARAGRARDRAPTCGDRERENELAGLVPRAHRLAG
jgi:hypothetical protein